jgi:hypothetical protein
LVVIDVFGFASTFCTGFCEPQENSNEVKPMKYNELRIVR